MGKPPREISNARALTDEFPNRIFKQFAELFQKINFVPFSKNNFWNPMIYIIVAKLSRRIKIGYSKNSSEVDTRFHYLRRDNADDLELLGRVEGDFEYERQLHTEVEAYRAHNEWFMAEPEVIQLVARELSAERTAQADLEKQISTMLS